MPIPDDLPTYHGQVPKLSDIWWWIGQATASNPVNERRQIRFNDSDEDRLLIRMTEEMGEVCQAHTRDGNDLEEIADLLAVLLHYAQKKGFSEEQLVQQTLDKLGKVFG